MSKGQIKVRPNSNGHKEAKSGCGGLHIRPVGSVLGPPNPITQKPKTFHVVLGLFDNEGNQAVHTLKNGENRPIVFLSLPLPYEESSIIL